VGRPVFGSVDVGSNSVHLLVAVVEGHRLEPLVDESEILGLGDVVDAHGAIPEPFRGELISTLARYAATARGLGARDVAFVGTQPLRRAADARGVVAAVEAATSVPLHVLDHAEEGLLNLLGATAGRRIEAPLAVVDVGGGSSEVVIVEPGRRARAGALAIGGASLTRELVRHDPPTAVEIGALRAAARTHLAGAPTGSPEVVLAVGGTASNLVKVVAAARRDRVLTARRLAVAQRTLGAAPAAAIAARFGIRATRARVLPAGAAILEALMERYGVARVDAVEEGIREGVVLALARAGRGWRDRLDAIAHGWAG
jgi:exopolyphosphatase/guanosine-5'-triphosphate,3'-diphosphate pyrophosphatase